MRVNHKGRDRHARRVAARSGFVPPAVVHPAIGSVLVLRSAEYGKSYNGSKVTLAAIEAGLYVVQSNRRKSPLRVLPAHVEAA